MKVTKRFRFEMAHRLPNHPGKCKQLHGHSYVLDVGVSGSIDSTTGMVVDFGDLKRIVQPIVEQWDHATMVHDTDVELAAALEQNGARVVRFPGPPTAELMAEYVANHVKVERPGFQHVTVRLYETADSWVEVTL